MERGDGDGDGDGDGETSREAQERTAGHHLKVPAGLTREEFAELAPFVHEFHTYRLRPGQCSSLLAQRVRAPRAAVWSIVRRFDKPQVYKHFIKSCAVAEGSALAVGSTRDVSVISGLPAETSTERLDVLDDERCVAGFSIIGGDHRLRNYRSSYVVDVPEGNTEEDARLFADTVVGLNLQKLASVAEGMAGDRQ
ncbi:hypothetical protein NL676_011543 [Syzygium grande]|nr:hypothetical protein NL676_011543 [Syzygium grande]